MNASTIPFGTVCPWPQQFKRRENKPRRARIRVRVRSFLTGEVLRYCSESEARFMCAENADGSDLLDMRGERVEAVAIRLSRRKAPLTDIKLLSQERGKRNSACTLTRSDVENNGLGKAFSALGVTDSIRAIERAENKVTAWPETHDTRAVVISAGKVHGAILVESIPDRVINFA